MGYRDKIEEKESYSLQKTALTSIIISSLMVALLGVFKAVELKKNGGADLILVFALAYVLPALCFIIPSFMLLFGLENKNNRRISSLLPFALSIFEVAAGIPMLAVFGNVEFMLVVFGIAVCELALGIVAYKDYKER